jgi:fumarate hydratase class I
VNDRFVALNMLRNACVSAGMVLPSCQDTGTAIVLGKKGSASGRAPTTRARSRAASSTSTSRPISATRRWRRSRRSRRRTPGRISRRNWSCTRRAGDEYRFLFVTKGGGSANKSFLYQETAAILNRERLLPFLESKVKTLGTAACPPYHLAIVIGGTSAELTMKTVKLASCRDLDDLPTRGDRAGHAIATPSSRTRSGA